MTWQIRGGAVSFARPVILGIVNVTPDSFSDGGNFFSPGAAVAYARALVAEGADLLDIGGESTRPQGAIRVPADEERRRILPVIEQVRASCPGVPISVDTVKADVAAAALDAGASVINDVSMLHEDPRLATVCAERGAGLILVHSRGDVPTMATYAHATYGPDVAGEVSSELSGQVDVARAAGVPAAAIVLDPGIGFAKRASHSLTVLAELPRIVALGYPVLVGVSRKRFIGEITGVTKAANRIYGSVGANVAALACGARLFRVHDVRAAREALDVAWAILCRDAASVEGQPAGAG
jgi:dihydropteroate synthase